MALGEMLRLILLPLILLTLTALPSPARAQFNAIAAAGAGGGPQMSRSDPVTFTADTVEYDRENALVIARGRVEAWQNDHVLRADQITFDRNTGVAAAKGNVVLLEPDGQVLFADYAEMTSNMRQGVLKGMRALLAENGRLAANGAQRTEGVINELSKVVYSTCNLCADNPERAPLWQIRAASAVQDLENKKIEYYDTVLQMYGVPVAYVPYFFHPDPSVKRQSGLLTPAAGTSSHVGVFYSQPYYWVIDDQSDATFIPTITSRSGPNLNLEYRRRFNSGYMVVNPSVGMTDGKTQAWIASQGQFSVNETWRWGFDINRATSANYVRNFNYGSRLVGGSNVLTSQIYGEGFGRGAYSRLDTKFYQGLNNTIDTAKLPVVLPRYMYSYLGRPDSWGGRMRIDTGAFNVLRSDGTSTRRAQLTASWERPFTGALGDLWKVTLRGDAIGYDASHLNDQPNFSQLNNTTAARALPQAAVDFRWPFMRSAGAWGTQLVEPMVQVIMAPQVGDSQTWRYPNEDSLDWEFTDANLFGFNRFPGVDRLEGGVRANVALHGAWYMGGTAFDGLIGQSYRTTKNYSFPAASGLQDQVSDVVVRGTFAPTRWLDLTGRMRLDNESLTPRMAEAIGSVGGPALRVSAGYLYSNYNPYYYYDQPPPPPAGSGYYTGRNEISLAVSSRLGRYRFEGNARRDLALNRMVSFGADLIYEDECFIFDFRVYRRYTSFNNDNGSTTVMFLFTLKTIGDFGYRAL
ncbi:MAG: LPS-assembly protein LptD [Acetobacteraceae bacterium]